MAPLPRRKSTPLTMGLDGQIRHAETGDPYDLPEITERFDWRQQGGPERPGRSSGSILIATSRPRRVSPALQTSPMPPSPNLAVISKWKRVAPNLLP